MLARAWSGRALAALLVFSLGCGQGKPEPNVESDVDDDGYDADVDCDDDDAAVYPGAEERCDGVDDDCDGEVDEVGAVDGETAWRDADADGAGDPLVTDTVCGAVDGWAAQGDDCDDSNPDISPQASETCDGVDDDCDGEIDEPGAEGGQEAWYDGDGDGYGDPELAGTACEGSAGWVDDASDCDDASADIHPGADELCDELDDDCDGETDEDPVDGSVYYYDGDGDSRGDDAVYVVACRRPTGYRLNGGDCDDTNSAVHPGVREVCDGLDNDCDGGVDVDASDALTWYADADGDGYGDDASAEEACDDPHGYGITTGGDCDDGDLDVNPGVAETWYDGLDEDCAGDSDYDQDGDGYVSSDLVDPEATTLDPGSGAVVDDGSATGEGDCDDLADGVHPGSIESCDEVDQDCDGLVDEDAVGASSWFSDGDGDGYGLSSTRLRLCDSPGTGWAGVGGDCDDGDADVNPSVEETWYDGVDEDCRRDSDYDQDGDGYVASDLEDADTLTLDPGSGAVVDDGSETEAGDCDDLRWRVHPAADEICDGLDDDCDGETDEGATDIGTWYLDEDGDGYGVDSSAEIACDAPSDRYADLSGDCDDDDADVNPGVAETWYDGLDEDCGEDSDYDRDGDRYVSSDLDDADAVTLDPGSGDVVDDGSATTAGDCDDSSSTIHPGATERCDSVDNDCDGEVDSDAAGAREAYLDSDGDGYGAPGTPIIKCVSVGTGYSTRSDDCDDSNARVNPGRDEACDDDDGLDDDCDGWTDLACGTGFFRYRYGLDTSSGALSCDEWWSADWSLSAESCPDCDWTFDVALTWREDLSDNRGACVDEDDPDMLLVLGVQDGSGVAWLYTEEDAGLWVAWTRGSLDDGVGRLTFEVGDEDSVVDGLYLTDAWSGVGELYEWTR